MPKQVAADEELPADATSAGRARKLLRAALRGRVGEDTVESAQLAVSEIVTNALLHAETAIRLRILFTDGRVRVEVADRSTRLPRRRGAGPMATGGRGLLIVEKLADRWGVDAEPGGKVVWFEVDRQPGRCA